LGRSFRIIYLQPFLTTSFTKNNDPKYLLGVIALKKTLKTISVLFLSLLGFFLLAALIMAFAFLIANKTNGSLVSSGEKRSYLLYVPASYDPQNPTPLVISIHGYAEWPAHQAQISRWNDLADEDGFIVVYPSGTGFPKHWRTMGLDANPVGVERDVQFISDLIDELEKNYNIDPARIYANGLSNGGGMSYLLACKLADRIAAIGSVSGGYTYPLDQCHPSRPVPLLAFHGTADPIVPFLGGPSKSFDIPFPVVPDWIKGWAERNQCTRTIHVPQDGEVSAVQYADCSQNANVIFVTIDGGGHAWPGGEPIPAWIVGYTSQQIDATRMMWNFFIGQPLIQ
jgi:polyhydroxybutyrate depolymerase